jgi:hypothetical protein
LSDQPLRREVRRLAQRVAEHHHRFREEAAYPHHRVACEQLEGALGAVGALEGFLVGPCHVAHRLASFSERGA